MFLARFTATILLPSAFGGVRKALNKVDTIHLSLHSLDTVLERVLWNTIPVASRIDETLATFCSTFGKDSNSNSIL